MDNHLKLLNDELVRLHDALALNASQNLELATWAMERITDIHAVLLNPTLIGAGSGGINYITNPDTEITTTGWTTYADTPAASRAIDDTDGSSTVTWTDSTGLIWYPAIEGTYTYSQALAKAEELGLRLPTIQEFEQVEKEGIRNKFNDFMGRWFWSSSPHPYGADYALVFDGNDGVDYGSRYSDVNSVRCVSKK